MCRLDSGPDLGTSMYELPYLGVVPPECGLDRLGHSQQQLDPGPHHPGKSALQTCPRVCHPRLVK